MITSRGPATAFLFAYALVDLLGGDSASLKEDMLVNRAIAKIRS
jgi:4-methyl-5(b-hydroxyethyl)-thiazole monophosphate biosynthesis